MTGTLKIHVLRKPGSKPGTMLTIDVTRLPCVDEIIFIEGAKGEEPAHYRVLQVAHTPDSPQVHGEVWTEPVANEEVSDCWKR
ncbi:MAG: hypothetical protein JO257_18585 [Deltaproteobacteria bacterium]|nr:hypothetical protein [Deltaproteobacteria bacterium]